MRKIHPLPLTAQSFERYGQVLFLDGRESEGVVVSKSDDLNDARTYAPIIDTVGSLGYTIARTLPTQITAMERHFDTEEGAFGAGLPFVLVVDDAEGEHPDPATVAAFIVPVGTVVKLNRGIWHDACLGLSEPTPYYWFAYCANNFLDEWAELPEPVELALEG
ncbi:MAG: ureidoglycolate lyase [Propionibacteriaceae bacterium]|jgi:ureidoglycolate lyase|nr:ureidoglycolate lyase [Propionibacteriaceae bacterium]